MYMYFFIYLEDLVHSYLRILSLSLIQLTRVIIFAPQNDDNKNYAEKGLGIETSEGDKESLRIR